MSGLETAIYTQFWHEILDRFGETSKMLQSTQINLNTAVKLLKLLKLFLDSKKNEFETYETAGEKFSNTQDYESIRGRTKNVRLQPLDYGKYLTPELTPRKKFRTKAFVQVIDQLIISLDERLSEYKIISDKFSFLADLSSNEPENLKQRSKNLVDFYPKDLESALENKLIQFNAFIENYNKNNDESDELFQYRNIVVNNLQGTFPNVEIAFRIYLCMMVSNCSGKRSFSKMKIIKNCLHTSMEQKRLVDLNRLSTESDIVRKLSFDVLDIFVQQKA